MRRLFLFSAVLLCLVIVTITPLQAQSPLIGEIRLWPAATPPFGNLSCDGTTLEVDDYPELYDVISCTFTLPGDCDGDHFTLPDYRGAFPTGFCPPGPECPHFTADLGEEGGEEEHTLTISEIPAHNHDGYRWVPSGGTHNWDTTAGGNYMTSLSTGNIGGGQDHNNMPPYIAINFIIAYTDTISSTTPTPTITPTPTSTPIITGTLPYISSYTQTLSSDHELVVPVYLTFGDIFVGAIGFLIIASFGLLMLVRVTSK